MDPQTRRHEIRGVAFWAHGPPNATPRNSWRRVLGAWTPKRDATKFVASRFGRMDPKTRRHEIRGVAFWAHGPQNAMPRNSWRRVLGAWTPKRDATKFVASRF